MVAGRARKFRLAVFAIFLAGQSGADPLQGMDREQSDKTCTHYENRARYPGNDGRLEFVSVLARSCRNALDRITNHRLHLSPYQARLTRAYLERLTDYHLMVLDLNMARFEDFRRLHPWETKGVRMTVTATGEYLIARQTGLLDLFSDWAAEAGYDVAIRH